MGKVLRATKKGDRAEQLRQLSLMLADRIDEEEDNDVLTKLIRQYRETIRELDDISGVDDGDEIGEIINKRNADGKPGAVR